MKRIFTLSWALFTLWSNLAQAQFADQRQYAPTSGGAANAQTVAVANYKLNPGVVIRFMAGLTNTGSTTVNVGLTSAVSVSKETGAGLVALSGGEIVSGQIVEIVYDGTQFELISPTTPAPTTSLVGPAVNFASGGTVDVGTAASHYAAISGTGTILSFGSSASTNAPLYYLLFEGASTIPLSAVMQTPGNTPLITSAGDVATLLYGGAGVWKITQYQPAFVSYGAMPGEIRTFAFGSCPTNWHETDGSAVSRTTYAQLFVNIGTAYGTGNGTTTFNLPDGRGYFVRSWANGGSVDAGRSLGTTQAAQVGAATGTITASSSSSATSTSTSAFTGAPTTSLPVAGSGGFFLSASSTSAIEQYGATYTPSGSVATNTTTAVTTTTTGTASTNAGNTDNRPTNIAYEQCIKL